MRSPGPVAGLGAFLVVSASWLVVACTEPLPTPRDAALLLGAELTHHRLDRTPTPSHAHAGRERYHRAGPEAAPSCASCHEATPKSDIAALHAIELPNGERVSRRATSLVDVDRLTVWGWDARWTKLEDALTHALPATDPVERERASRELGAYLASRASRGRFERFLDGDSQALEPEERRGLRLFLDRGCATCHGSRRLGGYGAFRLGAAGPYETRDPGRSATTGVERDRQVFRAPSLRHAAHSAAYFHDGSIRTLEEAIRLMGEIALGIDLPATEIDALAAFLRAVDDVETPQKNRGGGT